METMDKAFETTVTISYEIIRDDPYRYGEDADGHRGETRHEVEVDYTSIQVNGLRLKNFPELFRRDIVKYVDAHFEKEG